MKAIIINILFLVTAVITTSKGQAPVFSWIKETQSPYSTQNPTRNGVTDMVQDSQNNSYVAGYFMRSMVLGTDTLVSTGNTDAFAARYDANGNVLWARKLGGVYFAWGSNITIDQTGNTYVAGIFQNDIVFGNDTLDGNGDYDVFIAKFDSQGNPVWARKADGSGYEFSGGLSCDNAGNIYLTGSFDTPLTFGNVTLNSNGNYDTYLVKYNSSGSVIWARNYGGTGSDSGYGLITDNSDNSDNSDNLLLTGSFSSSATFGSTTITSAGTNSFYVAKFDSIGNVIWIQKSDGGFAEGFSVSLDKNGNCYLISTFSGTVTVGTTPFTFIGSMGDRNTLIAKYDIAGNLDWVKNSAISSNIWGRSIAADSAGNSYVTGDYMGLTVFGNDTLPTHGVADFFLAKYDAAGNLLWVKQGGGAGNDHGMALAIDNTGECYVAGSFGGYSATFDGVTFTTPGPDEVFIGKLDQNILLAATGEAAIADDLQLIASPNPVTSGSHLHVKITSGKASPVYLQLTDVLGRVIASRELSIRNGVLTQQFNMSQIQGGIYILTARQGNEIKQTKIIKH